MILFGNMSHGFRKGEFPVPIRLQEEVGFMQKADLIKTRSASCHSSLFSLYHHTICFLTSQ